MSESAGAPPSNAELLWQFDRDLAAGHEPAWDAILQRASDDDSRRELCADMIRCEANFHGWDLEIVRGRLQFYAQLDASDAGATSIIRGIYTDRLEAGEHPTRSEFARFGYEFDFMKLRSSGEPAYLGQVIAGRFQVEQQLGSGSFGVVYRGTELASERTVALKMIRVASEEQMSVARTLLRQEADVLATLRTTGIPQRLDFLENSESGPVLVLKFIDGLTVHQLRGQGPLSPQRAATIVARLATTLQFVHRRGYLHRDLSPTNILVDQYDSPYLTDFGLGFAQEELFDQERHTAGTHGYMSFESLVGTTREIDARDDIWALGILLYELLTGQAAPRQSRAQALAAAHNFESALAAASATIPPALRRICQRCAADYPDDRFDAVGLVARELQSYLGAALSPVDEERVDLTQRRLWVWRMGVLFGNAVGCHAYARWRLERLLSESTSDSQTVGAASRLIFANTKMMLDEFVRCTVMAGKLGISVATFSGIPEFVNAYNNNRDRTDPDTCRWLLGFLDAAGSNLWANYQQWEAELSAKGSEMTALLKFALAAGSKALGPNVPQGLASLTEAAGLSSQTTGIYIGYLSANPDPDTDGHEREVDRLRKTVERELMHQLADALGDPTDSASPHSTNS